jgi:hypothetical protein
MVFCFVTGTNNLENIGIGFGGKTILQVSNIGKQQ